MTYRLSYRFCLQLDAVLFVLSDVEGDTLAWVVDRPGVFVISLALWAVSDHQRSSGYVWASALLFSGYLICPRILQFHSLVSHRIFHPVPPLGRPSDL